MREPRHLAVVADDDVRVDDGRAVLGVGAADDTCRSGQLGTRLTLGNGSGSLDMNT